MQDEIEAQKIVTDVADRLCSKIQMKNIQAEARFLERLYSCGESSPYGARMLCEKIDSLVSELRSVKALAQNFLNEEILRPERPKICGTTPTTLHHRTVNSFLVIGQIG